MIAGLAIAERAAAAPAERRGRPAVKVAPRNTTHHKSLAPAPGRRKPVTEQPGVWLDARGHRRTKVTIPGYGRGRVPASKGKTYRPDPPTVAERMILLNACGNDPAGERLRAWMIFAGQTGMRIGEIAALLEQDIDVDKGSIIIHTSKTGRPRVVGMDPWGWRQARPWLEIRPQLPPGPLFCVIDGPTAGREWGPSQVRHELHRLALAAGVRKRIHPHGFRHAFATERVREGMALHLLRQQMGHADLRTLARYLSGILSDEVLEQARIRPLPAISAPDMLEVLSHDHC